MQRGSGNWGVGGRTPGIPGQCPGLGVGTYMPLTPKHEQRVERQTARKKNQSSAQGPAEAASFTYRRRASSCGESLGWEEQRPFLLAASETSAGAGTSPGWDVGWEQAQHGGSGAGSGTPGPGNTDTCVLGAREESYSGRGLGLSLSLFVQSLM